MSEKRIYFLRPVGQIGPIKIGCSVMPEQRLDTYLPWSPVKLELILTVPGGHAQERTLHGLFLKDWLHHEWFGASKELLALIEQVREVGALPELPRVIKFPPRKPRQRLGPRGATQKTVDFGNLVRAEYESAVSLEAIAAKHGVCASSVSRALRSVGVAVKGRGRPRTEKRSVQDIERAKDFADKYLAGATLEEIGKEHGITRERVRQVLRDFDVPSLGRRPKERPPLSPEEARIVALGTGEMTAAEIAREVELPKTRVVYIIRREGGKVAPGWHRREDDAWRLKTIADLYQRGVPAGKIFEQIPGMRHPMQIYRYLYRAGIKKRGRAA